MYNNTISSKCIDPPCLVKCSGQGGGFVSCSPKYIIKKKKFTGVSKHDTSNAPRGLVWTDRMIYLAFYFENSTALF